MSLSSAISKAVSAVKSITSKASSSKTSSNSSSSSKSSSSSSSGSSSSSSSTPVREYAYTWKDGSTTYSHSNNYLTAQKEAGKSGVGLVGSTSYLGGSKLSTPESNNAYQNAINYEQQVANSYGLTSGYSTPTSGSGGISTFPGIAENPTVSNPAYTVPITTPTNNSYVDYISQINDLMSAYQSNADASYQSLLKQIEANKSSPTTTNNYITSDSNKLNSTARNVYSDGSADYNKAMNKGATIKKTSGGSGAISRYLANNAFNDSKFNR